MIRTQVLVVDDDDVIVQSTAEYFNMFGVVTEYVTSFDAAEEYLNTHTVSLLLLDINLGEQSGFELCKKIREKYDMPILFISARTSDDDVLIALNIGGDDYITKPFTLSVLLAKVKAVLARYEKARERADEDKIHAMTTNLSEDKHERGQYKLAEGIILDTNMHRLIKEEKPVSLKDMEYKLLLYLCENAGRVVTKDELLKNVWEDEFVGEGTIAVHIRHLREKIEDDPKNVEIIKTIWGVGYTLRENSFEEEV